MDGDVPVSIQTSPDGNHQRLTYIADRNPLMPFVGKETVTITRDFNTYTIDDVDGSHRSFVRALPNNRVQTDLYPNPEFPSPRTAGSVRDTVMDVFQNVYLLNGRSGIVNIAYITEALQKVSFAPSEERAEWPKSSFIPQWPHPPAPQGNGKVHN